MNISNIFAVLYDNLFRLDRIDWIIFVVMLWNFFIYHKISRPTNKIYYHFIRANPLGNLNNTSIRKIKKNTKADTQLTTSELLDYRETMNKNYSLYSNITTIFPLLGMLGTVVSLLFIGSENTETMESFFTALTSTFWGIIWAIVFKVFDSKISWKIEDNEKYMNHLIMPNIEDNEKTEIDEKSMEYLLHSEIKKQ